jgi:hypothetical protein
MEIPNIKGCSGAPAIVAGITTTDARCKVYSSNYFCTRRKLDRHLFRFVSIINKNPIEEGYEIVVMVEMEARNMIVGDSTLDPSTA